MTPDKSELVSVFKKEVENLAGKCHVASGLDEISRIVSEIATHNDCANVVKQRLGIRGEEQINKALERYGVHVTELEESANPVEALSKADMTITPADLLIAQTGSLVMSTIRDEDRLASCLSRIHVSIVSADNIVFSPLETAEYLKNRVQSDTSGSITFVSGPSRTADIEMKLVLGVHGPHQVHVIIIKS